MNAGLEIVTFIIGQIVVAAAIWGSIRSDIKNIHERMNELKRSIDQAHSRLDHHIEQQMGFVNSRWREDNGK